jgi:hypothetical protein
MAHIWDVTMKNATPHDEERHNPLKPRLPSLNPKNSNIQDTWPESLTWSSDKNTHPAIYSFRAQEY